MVPGVHELIPSSAVPSAKREPREDENSDDEWHAESCGVGELHVFCPECWRREFGEDEEARPAEIAG